MEKRKVYCNNCKFDGGMNNIVSCWRWCENKEAMNDKYEKIFGKQSKSRYTGFGEDHEYPIIKTELNLDGKCKYYKRKWWKFWVKQS